MNIGEKKEYAVYKGEYFKFMGTASECATHMKINILTFRHYLTPSYLKRVSERKKARNYITVIRLDDED